VLDALGITDEMVVELHEGVRQAWEWQRKEEIAALLRELHARPDMDASEREAKLVEIQHRLDVISCPVAVDGAEIGPDFYPPARGTGEVSDPADADADADHDALEKRGREAANALNSCAGFDREEDYHGGATRRGSIAALRLARSRDGARIIRLKRRVCG
jgi:hypothetical protein